MADHDLLDHIRGFQAELTEIRHDIHARPELGLEEHRTAELVGRKLAEMGIEVHRGVGGTGVVGVLRVGDGASTIGLRADMDALPIEEETNLPYRSQNQGRMHACGHDGHTTILLGAARYLAETRHFNGTVNFIFQPGEEGVGGALAMLNDGLFERFPCQAVYGIHNRPGMAVGKYAICPGPAMAGGAFFDIAVTGRGAHGARPEQSIDSALAACQIAIALQTIVSRNISAWDNVVLSITRVQAGQAYNVNSGERDARRHGARNATGDTRPGGNRDATDRDQRGGIARCLSERGVPTDLRAAGQSRRTYGGAGRYSCGTGRRGAGGPGEAAGDGVRGLRLHAGAGAGRLHERRQWRGECSGAQRALQFQ
jgi:acetylornithine deacetylase/succinyl-diaminopimelate desuccinylase-like protein